MLVSFFGGVRDYHAMDWFRSAVEIYGTAGVKFYTDLRGGEGYNSFALDSDVVVDLYVLDNLLPRRQSRFSDYWRNFLKLVIAPLQAYRLKRLVEDNEVLFCHGVYYMVVARMAGIRYFGTPQGSEILVRPYKSTFYKSFLKFALSRAIFLTVDSRAMKSGINRIVQNVPVHIVQNGVDIKAFKRYKTRKEGGDQILSIRALTSLYRIKELFLQRNRFLQGVPIKCLFPFEIVEYRKEIQSLSNSEDKMLGRLSKPYYYEELAKARIVVSIPSSDSSPRSVYEAIFLNCICIVSNNSYVQDLPLSMRSRIVVCDMNAESWLKDALKRAEDIIDDFTPCLKAIEMFDQLKSLEKIYHLAYDSM